MKVFCFGEMCFVYTVARRTRPRAVIVRDFLCPEGRSKSKDVLDTCKCTLKDCRNPINSHFTPRIRTMFTVISKIKHHTNQPRCSHHRNPSIPLPSHKSYPANETTSMRFKCSALIDYVLRSVCLIPTVLSNSSPQHVRLIFHPSQSSGLRCTHRTWRSEHAQAEQHLRPRSRGTCTDRASGGLSLGTGATRWRTFRRTGRCCGRSAQTAHGRICTCVCVCVVEVYL